MNFGYHNMFDNVTEGNEKEIVVATNRNISWENRTGDKEEDEGEDLLWFLQTLYTAS